MRGIIKMIVSFSRKGKLQSSATVAIIKESELTKKILTGIFRSTRTKGASPPVQN